MKSSQVTKSFQIFFCLAVFLLALAARFYGLTFKPIHFDESINGWFSQQMIELGYFKYDPNNYHGPLYFYILRLFETIWGVSLQTLRTVPAVFSIASVMIFLWGWARSTTWGLWMVVFILLSPAFVFFGRSGIHEMPFVFFQMLFALGMMRWLQQDQDSRAWGLVLIGAFGMITLKETFAISGAAAVCGLLSLGLPYLRKNFSWSNLKAPWNAKLTALAVILLFLFLGLFSGFGKNPSGIFDFVRAFLPWMKTGTHGAGHEKEFLYWIKTLVDAEPLALAGLALSFIGVFSRDLSLRWISVMGLVQLLVYSLIPYKTIWCILSLVWPFYFVLAAYAEILFRAKVPWKITTAVIITLGGLLHARSLWLSSYREPIDLDHPYVYVNSTYELKAISEILLRAVKENPDLRNKIWQIGMTEQWPWPWVLRSVQSLNFTPCHDRIVEDAVVYFCDQGQQGQLESLLKARYIKLTTPLRQHQYDSVIYLRSDFFAPYFSEDVEQVGPTEGEAP